MLSIFVKYIEQFIYKWRFSSNLTNANNPLERRLLQVSMRTYAFSRAYRHGHAKQILAENRKSDKFWVINIVDLWIIVKTSQNINTNSGFHASMFEKNVLRLVPLNKLQALQARGLKGECLRLTR